METLVSDYSKPLLTWIKSKFKCIEEVRPWSGTLTNFWILLYLSGSGGIGLEEFYNFYGITRSKFVDRLFGEFDLDGSENLSFEEFVVGVWNFCTLNFTRLCKYSMDIFDVDHKMTINKYQCDALVRMVHNSPETPASMQAIVSEITEEMNLQDFTAFAEKHESLLRPVVQVQANLRNRLLGLNFWEARTKLRTETFGELEPTDNILLRKRRDIVEKQKTMRLSQVSSNSALAGGRVVPDFVPSVSPLDGSIVGGIKSSSLGSGLLSRSVEDSSSLNTQKKLISGLNPAILEESEADSEGNIYEFNETIKRTATREDASNTLKLVKRCQVAYLRAVEAYEQKSMEIFASQEEEQLAENEVLAQAAAKAKQDFQNAVNKLEKVGKECIDEAEKQLYVQAIALVEEEARAFFRTPEGRDHLRIVGGEHALRDENSTNRLGMITKKARQAGEERARNEYIARKACDQNTLIAEIIKDRNDAHVEKVGDLYKKFLLLREVDDKLVRDWQWQKILDQESKQFYFHCPATQDTLWAEPYLLNSEGWCEDPSCKNEATIRCVSCNAEYCADCDMILHAYGPKHNHKRRAQIPLEEVHWREKARKLPKNVRHIVTRSLCTDSVELLRRHQLDKERIDNELYGITPDASTSLKKLSDPSEELGLLSLEDVDSESSESSDA